MCKIAIGYLYDSEGNYETRHIMDADADVISRFICQFPMNDKVITDEYDELLCSTIGIFLDRVPDRKFRDGILRTIIPYQTGEKKLASLEFVEDDGCMVQKELAK